MGPEAGLAALDAVAGDRRLEGLSALLGRSGPTFADRAGRLAEAQAAYLRAIGLEVDPAVRVSLQDRLAAMTAGRAF
ncbi:MAG: hypothetical protein WDN45_04670 [Caulobacteraceae bacterium]